MYRLLVFAVIAVSCSQTAAQPNGDESPSSSTSSTAAVTGRAEVSTTTAPSSAPTTEPPEGSGEQGEPMSEEFSVHVEAVTVDELGTSWREDCPVGLADLRRMRVPHHDLAGEVVEGELIVHHAAVESLVQVFGRLFDAGFPIESMRPITEFDGDDNRSMAANNSSAFNCRVIEGTSRWSEHAYGMAIDINPLINPWVRGSQVDPPGGADYLDRTGEIPGLITAEGVVVAAFAEVGWGWGGDWTNSLDYQHFSASGR